MGAERVGYDWATELSMCCVQSAKLWPILCNPVNCSMPGFPTLHYLPEFAQTHVHWVCDAMQSSQSLQPTSFAFNLSQPQGHLQGVSYSHQVAKVLELQLLHQSFQWIFRTDFLWDHTRDHGENIRAEQHGQLEMKMMHLIHFILISALLLLKTQSSGVHPLDLLTQSFQRRNSVISQCPGWFLWNHLT